MNNQNSTLSEKDLLSFGDTSYDDKDGLVKIFDCEKSLDILRFRKLIKKLKYRVISEKNCTWENGDVGIEVKTNYPWKRYEKLHLSN